MAVLYPGVNEAKGNSPTKSALFHLLPSQMFVYTFATGAAACEIEMEFGFLRISPFEVRLSVIDWLSDTKQNLLKSCLE